MCMQCSVVPVLVPARDASPFMPGRMYIEVMDISASRTISTRDLIQAGLHNLDTARELIARATEHLPDELVTVLLNALKGTGDPDTALRSLVDIHEHCRNAADNDLGCFQHEDALCKLIKVVGNSEYFGTLMRTRPDLVQAACGDQYHGTAMDSDQRRDMIWNAVQGIGEVPSPVVRLARQSDALRAAYRRQLVSIMVEDLCADDAMEIQPQVSRALSDLVDAALTAALRIAQEHVPNGDKCRFTIIGMGKLGAREINYISDVDVMYVVEPVKQAEVQDDHEELRGMALTRVGTKIGALVQRLCQSVIPGGSEPALWQIDNALRSVGAHTGVLQGILRTVGGELGISGFAQSQAMRGRRSPRTGLFGHGPSYGVVSIGKKELCIRLPANAQTSRIPDTGSIEKPRDETRQRRAEGCRIHCANAAISAWPIG